MINDMLKKKIPEFYSKSEFNSLTKTKNFYKFLKHYNSLDLMVAMHAHAQLISIAVNVPCISFSTMDKISDFCEKHDLLEYDVDFDCFPMPEAIDRFEDILDKFNNDKNFLEGWYDKRDALVNKFSIQYDQEIKKIWSLIS